MEADTKPAPISPSFYSECSDITERYEKLWGRWNIDSQLLHIVTEVAELKDVLRNKGSKYGAIDSPKYISKLLDELADVFLTSFATANYLEIDVQQLNEALRNKLIEVGIRVSKLEAER